MNFARISFRLLSISFASLTLYFSFGWILNARPGYFHEWPEFKHIILIKNEACMKRDLNSLLGKTLTYDIAYTNKIIIGHPSIKRKFATSIHIDDDGIVRRISCEPILGGFQ